MRHARISGSSYIQNIVRLEISEQTTVAVHCALDSWSRMILQVVAHMVHVQTNQKWGGGASKKLSVWLVCGTGRASVCGAPAGGAPA